MKNKRILITGGTGSFGSVMAERLLSMNIGEVVILSRDEKKQDDMRDKYKDHRLKFVIADVRDMWSMEKAFSGIDYVFHTAALKQVPSCEFFPLEAVKTNVLGTNNVINLAERMGVSKTVCLSTDKAAYPVNAMGISKAMLEKLVFATSQSEGRTITCCTRYGNVMCSRGSVIPKFIELAKKGEPLPITNKRMTRFMMSLDDSVDLVLFALKNAQKGDLFVQKSASCFIYDLAEVINDMFGNSAGLVKIGTRHGEKLNETLLTSEEYSRAEDLGNFYRVAMDNRSLYYDEPKTEKHSLVGYTSEMELMNKKEIKEMLLKQPYVKKEMS